MCEPRLPFFVLSQTRRLALQPLFQCLELCPESGDKGPARVGGGKASLRQTLAPSLTWSHWGRNSFHWPLRTLGAELSSAFLSPLPHSSRPGHGPLPVASSVAKPTVTLTVTSVLVWYPLHAVLAQLASQHMRSHLPSQSRGCSTPSSTSLSPFMHLGWLSLPVLTSCTVGGAGTGGYQLAEPWFAL